MSLCSNTQAIMAAYPEGRPAWAERINSLSQKSWDDAKLVLADSSFKTYRNQTYENLIQRVMFPVWRAISAICMFESLHKGEWGTGNFMQELGFINLLQQMEYKGTHVANSERFGGDYDQFKPRIQQPRAAYHAINRQAWYGITMDDLFVRRAFLDQQGISQALANTLELLYASNKVDNELYYKRMFVDFACSDEFPIQDTQVVELPDICKENTTSEEIRLAFGRIMSVQMYSLRNNSMYNAIGRPNVADNSIIIMDLLATVWNQYNNMSIIFHPENSAIPVPEKILVDNFGDDRLSAGKREISGNIIGILTQKETFGHYTAYQDVEPARDAIGKYTNQFLHCFDMYRASPFFNCVYFVRNKEKFLADCRKQKPDGFTCSVEQEEQKIQSELKKGKSQ